MDTAYLRKVSFISYVENALTQAISVLFLAYLSCIITNLRFGVRNKILYLSLRSYISEAITLANLYSLLRRGIYKRYKRLRYTHQPSNPRLYLLLCIWNQTSRAVPTEITWEGSRTFRGVLEDYHCQVLKILRIFHPAAFSARGTVNSGITLRFYGGWSLISLMWWET